jgi:hypothetical protein
LLKCGTLINESHRLASQRVSQVSLFLIADLDRVYKADLPHGYTIAYAMKGYSMKTDVIRPKKNMCVYCHLLRKKIGSVGRIYFFF